MDGTAAGCRQPTVQLCDNVRLQGDSEVFCAEFVLKKYIQQCVLCTIRKRQEINATRKLLDELDFKRKHIYNMRN